ncbi:MAG: MarR family transcriptional regulator [Fimbriimonadaceae bacterium]|nr:MarR family transcriptional regulator [Fimbriimonadaceae bacterium]
MSNRRVRLDKKEYERLAAFRATLRRFVRRTEERARAVGITPQQQQALLGVMGSPGKDWASVAELADFLQVRHNSAVELVDRCEKAGLMRRVQDESDRRLVHVTLTPKGKSVLDQCAEVSWAELHSLGRTISFAPDGEE